MRGEFLNWRIKCLGLGRDEKPERQAARRELGEEAR